MLSMIETAIEVTDGRVPGSVISDILSAGQDMLRHPIELLPHAEESIRALAPSHRLVLITKGDLLDQERKLAQSGLGDLFDAIENRVGKDTRHLCKNFRPPWRRGRTRAYGRKLAAVRRGRPDHGRGLGRACAARAGMGNRARGPAPRPPAISRAAPFGRVAPILSAGSTAADAASCGQSWADRYTCAKNIKNCPKHVE